MEQHLEEALAAIRLERLRIAPILEGLRDYARLNLGAEAAAAVAEALALYMARDAALQAAEAALGALIDLPPITLSPISPDAYQDLDAQQHTIAAAFAEFTEGAAVVSIEWSAPEEQKEQT